MKELLENLAKIQQQLKAPKNQYNSFGKYKYRSCEDILEAVKPLLGTLVLTLFDDVVLIGERYYIKATATLMGGNNAISVSSFAREPLSRKGQDESQLTGAASSYARKYALNGLFCIDDEKDADFNGTNTEGAKPVTETKKKQAKKQTTEPVTEPVTDVVRKIYDKYMDNSPPGKVVDMGTLRKLIWEKYGTYPTREASVDKVCSEIPITDVIVDNNFISGID